MIKLILAFLSGGAAGVIVMALVAGRGDDE